jgi:hypothetical protein
MWDNAVLGRYDLPVIDLAYGMAGVSSGLMMWNLCTHIFRPMVPTAKRL